MEQVDDNCPVVATAPLLGNEDGHRSYGSNHLNLNNNNGRNHNSSSSSNGNRPSPHVVNYSGDEVVTSKSSGGASSWMCQLLCCISNADEAPSNETLLSTAFITFLAFTIAQFFAALIANSEAMMADTAAMSVDAMTYAFNLFAERTKRTASRKQRLQLELIPPLISVTTLIILNAFVTKTAIQTLMLSDEDSALSGQPDVFLMFLFSSVNLMLDIVNVGCFAKARKLLGFSVTDLGTSVDHLGKHSHEKQLHKSKEREQVSTPMSEYTLPDEDLQDFDEHDLEDNHRPNHPRNQKSKTLASTTTESTTTIATVHPSLTPTIPYPVVIPPRVGGTSPDDVEDFDKICAYVENLTTTEEGGSLSYCPSDPDLLAGTSEDSANLNMCSAYTHVFADTLRSIAVILAAGCAGLVEGIDPLKADAVAALVVTVVITMSLFPLFKGLIYTWAELRSLTTSEEAEDGKKKMKKRGKLDRNGGGKIRVQRGTVDATGEMASTALVLADV